FGLRLWSHPLDVLLGARIDFSAAERGPLDGVRPARGLEVFARRAPDVSGGRLGPLVVRHARALRPRDEAREQRATPENEADRELTCGRNVLDVPRVERRFGSELLVADELVVAREHELAARVGRDALEHALAFETAALDP